MQTGIQSQNTQGLGLVMAAAALWATVGVASQLVPDHRALSDIALGGLRMALGGPVILVLAALAGQLRLEALRRLDPLPLAGFALGSLVFQVCLFRAFDSLGVTATVFLTVCLPPPLSCLLAWAKGRQSLGAGAWMALGLATAGLAVFGLATGGAATGGRAGEGLVLALVAALAFVLLTDCARALTRRAGPLIVAGTGLTLAGLPLVLALLAFAPQTLALPSEQSWSVLALVSYLVLGPTALAYVAYCSGMARCRSAQAGLIASMIEPGLAALLGWALLGEVLSPGEALGCALVLAAMLVLWRSERRG